MNKFLREYRLKVKAPVIELKGFGFRGIKFVTNIYWTTFPAADLSKTLAEFRASLAIRTHRLRIIILERPSE